ncbi:MULTISPECIES: DUF262 domain-containing protein [Pseudomonadota]|uniref:Type I restriction-modification system protein n=1 Tax=Enhydrobacter aerosaccus TaxID=225324 RepID=A0ABR5IJS2_9HYPH|nr:MULTISPECIES: DUF262 domain-containing protein [Pseudomonadota]KND17687.1 type I restriction-modification system protein [Enhydrobacter aerosaccus]MCK6053305.1 DUF262 domain-containing HNH endonuclease family protein [Moraxella osloensis]
MIKSVFNYPISTLLDIESNIIYSIPRYQREYTWGKPQWERLFDDLVENNSGYYLGSIICINQSQDAITIQDLEVVDGQQRLTTISLLLAAVYKALKSKQSLTDEENFELLKLKNKLVMRKDSKQPRLIPQVQNNNQLDYFYVLSLTGILEEKDCPSNAGNRRILRGYRYFLEKIEQYASENGDNDSFFQLLLDRVNSATLVKIEVNNHSDAYTLFESLNNRGVPLTAIDLIKNKLLSQLEKLEPGSIDDNYDSWKKVIEALGDDYNVQERFFRQYYNAYRSEIKNIVLVPIATKSNLMQIYEKLVNHNPKKFLNDMVRLSKIYANLINQNPVEEIKLRNLLQSLERVQAAPSYLLLLILFDKKQSLQLENHHFEKIIDFLIRFFVRRNTTDLPPTRDLTRIFMDLAENCLLKQGDEIVRFIETQLSSQSASDEKFKNSLSSQIYEENKAICRFVLCSLEEEQMTKEREVDLWKVQGKQYIWTIEHIFPQGENIPADWVKMIANGDKYLAKSYLNSHVHQLGNLTISGYNSSLGNKSFAEKRDREDNNKRYVGYKNGLFLNNELKNENEWTIEKIEKRTKFLVSLILKKYSLVSV